VRVAIDVQPLQAIGGIATYTLALLDHLPPGEALPYFAALRGRDRVDLADLRVAPWPARVAERLWRRTGVRLPLAPAIPADLLHGTNFLPPLSRLPTVITVHDLSALRHPAWHPPEMLRQARLWADAARRARRVVAVSEVVARDVVGLLGIPPDRVRTVPLAPTPLPAPDLSVLARLGLAGQPFILAVGALEPRKNLPRLVEAFRACRAASGHRLVLAGPHGDGARAVASAARGEDRVLLAGRVTGAELAALHGTAAVLAYPSLYEGFGLPPLDAMLAGVPVVASTAGSLPEVLGDAALLVEPTDTRALASALDRVLGDPALAADLAARGRERAAAYSWARTADLTRAVYREALR